MIEYLNEIEIKIENVLACLLGRKTGHTLPVKSYAVKNVYLISYTVRKEIKCIGDSEKLHEIVIITNCFLIF